MLPHLFIRLKGKYSVNISSNVIDEDKILNKIQHSLLIKSSANKITKEYFFSLIKCIYDKHTATSY